MQDPVGNKRLIGQLLLDLRDVIDQQYKSCKPACKELTCENGSMQCPEAFGTNSTAKAQKQSGPYWCAVAAHPTDLLRPCLVKARCKQQEQVLP